jgi:hypothetical protein
MLDLVACSLPTIDLKLDVIGCKLSNFTELDKIALGQDVNGFHVVSGAQTLKNYDIAPL